jgi:rare lipoprotein A
LRSIAPIPIPRNGGSEFALSRRGVPMRTLSKFLAAAALSSCIAGYAKPVAAQTFEERWSIIPKAHADPASQPPDRTNETNGDSQAQAPSTRDPRNRNSPEQHSGPARRTFTGNASFYSYRRAKTATGSSFDRDDLTAAHRSLPFGTKVRVTDMATNRSVIVRITDRGPFVRSRVLDLSLAAARSLRITDRGVVQIRAEVL